MTRPCKGHIVAQLTVTAVRIVAFVVDTVFAVLFNNLCFAS